jgi:hypothetical protein
MEPCGGWGAGLPRPAQPRLASRPPPLRLCWRICPALPGGMRLQRAPPEDPPTGSAASGSRQEAIRAGGTGLGCLSPYLPLRHLLPRAWPTRPSLPHSPHAEEARHAPSRSTRASPVCAGGLLRDAASQLLRMRWEGVSRPVVPGRRALSFRIARSASPEPIAADVFGRARRASHPVLHRRGYGFRAPLRAIRNDSGSAARRRAAFLDAAGDPGPRGRRLVPLDSEPETRKAARGRPFHCRSAVRKP